MKPFKFRFWGTFLVVQWVRLRAPSAGGPGLIADWGTRSRILQPSPRVTTKIPRAATKTQHSLNKY